jgi:hypothetical protein
MSMRPLTTWVITCDHCGTSCRREEPGTTRPDVPDGWGHTIPYQMEYGYSNPRDLCPTCLDRYTKGREADGSNR